MSRRPQLNIAACDPLIGSDISAFSPRSPSRAPFSSRSAISSNNMEVEPLMAGESDPLLGAPALHRKPFYRARPLWLVPFAITAAIVRGMTLAPRVEVFTQLSCNALYGHHNYNHTRDQAVTSLHFSLDPLGPPVSPQYLSYALDNSSPTWRPHSLDNSESQDDEDEGEDPRRLPSGRCLSDPAVQAGAARLQTIMTTTMGLLSALTTGWWGHFGERRGRTKVLATATFGLFLTDLTFILVSTPSSPFSSHGHKFLFVAPVVEGLLGGWTTLQSATSAYISDCTSSGSRAQIFSRFTGVFYIGLSVGPSIGGYLIRNPILVPPGVDEKIQTVTSVFWVAVFCSFVNFILVLFVFPESVDKERREKSLAEHASKGRADVKGKQRTTVGNQDNTAPDVCSDSLDETAKGGIIQAFLSPLAIFLPTIVMDGERKRTDWSLTFLAAALFGYMLSSGVYQLKYLYATHEFSWGAEQLSYYISFMNGAKASFLLFLLPTIISMLKPKPAPKKSKSANKTGNSATPVPTGKKPKPTRAQLTQEISFDLILTRCSLVIDILSNTLVSLVPSVPRGVHSFLDSADPNTPHSVKDQALFVMASSLSSLGSGAVPAIQSLALCIMQMRTSGSENGAEASEAGVGTLFGALAVLQAVGQMIVGPMLFGLIYSGTVATFPKAIFTTAAGILVVSLALVMCVRNPGEKTKGKKRSRDDDVERGRSRVSKDLRVPVPEQSEYGSINGAPQGDAQAGPSTYA